MRMHATCIGFAHLAHAAVSLLCSGGSPRYPIRSFACGYSLRPRDTRVTLIHSDSHHPSCVAHVRPLCVQCNLSLDEASRLAQSVKFELHKHLFDAFDS